MRSLIPHFFVSTRPLGWKCDHCGQRFPLPEPIVRLPDAAPFAIQAEFMAHDCQRFRQNVALKQSAAQND